MIKKAYVDTSEGQLHYRYTTEGQGAPLVLFHKTAAASNAFEAVMRELDGSVPMFAFDTPNYGESYTTTREPSIPYVAEVMLEALDSVGVQTFHTFGHHTGTAIQAELAVRVPDRVLSTIMNGIIYATEAERSRYTDTLSHSNPITVRGTQIMWAWSRAKDSYQVDVYGGREDADPAVAAPILHRETINTLVAGEHWEWGYLAVYRYDLIAAMEKVSCPVLLISGRHDPSFRLQERAAAELPAAQTYVHEDSGIFYGETHAADLASQVAGYLARISSR